MSVPLERRTLWVKFSCGGQVPVVLVASSTKAKKRRKGGASFPEDTIVDPTGDHMVEERQYTVLQVQEPLAQGFFVSMLF